MTLEQRIHDGSRAKEVLENEQFIASFEAIEKELTEQWKNSPARDEAAREKLWLMLQMLLKVQQTLETTLETGKLASKELQHRQTMMEKARGLLSRAA